MKRNSEGSRDWSSKTYCKLCGSEVADGLFYCPTCLAFVSELKNSGVEDETQIIDDLKWGWQSSVAEFGQYSPATRKCIFDWLVGHKNFKSILDNIDNFPEQSADKDLVKRFLANVEEMPTEEKRNKIYEMLERADVFESLDNEIAKVIVEHGIAFPFYNLSLFFKEGEEQKIRDLFIWGEANKKKFSFYDANPHSIVMFSLTKQNYKNVLILARVLPEVGENIRRFSDDLSVRLANFVKEGMWKKAGDLLLLLEEVGEVVDPTLKKQIAKESAKEDGRREKRIKHNVYEGQKVDPRELMVNFYMDEYILSRLKKTREALMLDGKDLSLSTKIMVNEDLETPSTEDLKKTTAWLKEYVLHIVVDELGTQGGSRNIIEVPFLKGVPHSGDRVHDFVKYATEQEALELLSSAIGRFGETRSFHHEFGDYGGENWAKIAEALSLLWKASTLQDTLVAVDHIIDLAHNGGTIFDKNWSKGKYAISWIDINKLFKVKSQAKDINELLALCSNELKPEVMAKLSERLRILQDDFVDFDEKSGEYTGNTNLIIPGGD